MDQPVICQQPDNKKSPGIDSVDSGFYFEEESQIKKPAEDTKTLTEEGAMGANAGGTTSSTTGDCCYYCNCYVFNRWNCQELNDWQIQQFNNFNNSIIGQISIIELLEKFNHWIMEFLKIWK